MYQEAANARVHALREQLGIGEGFAAQLQQQVTPQVTPDLPRSGSARNDSSAAAGQMARAVRARPAPPEWLTLPAAGRFAVAYVARFLGPGRPARTRSWSPNRPSGRIRQRSEARLEKERLTAVGFRGTSRYVERATWRTAACRGPRRSRWTPSFLDAWS
jgi:hypothetical protein